MAFLDDLPTFVSRDRNQHRADARQLDQFRRRDFSSMTTEINRIRKHEKLPVRAFPLVWRLCRDWGRSYILRPHRDFAGLTKAQTEELKKLYRKLRVNRVLRNVQEKLAVMNAVVVTCTPQGAWNGPLALESWCVHQVSDPVFADPQVTDIRLAQRVEIAVAVQVTLDNVVMGRRVYTPSEAWVEVGGKRLRGIFREDMKNPFGRIPMVAIHREEPADGEFWPVIAYDALMVSIAVNLLLSMVEHVSHNASFPERTLSGSNADHVAKRMRTGVKGIIPLPSTAQNPLEYKIHNLNPATDKTLEVVERIVKHWAVNNYISPESLIGSSGITGDAKAVERQDQDEELKRNEGDFEDFEQDLCELIIETRRLTALTRLREVPEVTVRHRHVESDRNVLQRAQAREVLMSQGFLDAVEDLAGELGVDREKAETALFKTIDVYRRIREARGDTGKTAGLDRTEKAVGGAS